VINFLKDKTKHSLFFKLFLIFTALEIAIVATFIISFKLCAEKPFRKVFHKNISNYIQYIIDDVGKPVTVKKLKEISEKTDVSLIYNNLKSNPKLPNLNQLEYFHEKEGRYSFAQYQHTKYILFEDGSNTYALGIDLLRRDNFPTLPLAVAGFISLILLKITYGAVRKLFKPLDRIKEGASHFANGNFDHKIPVNGKGQLSELTKSINDMGEKIQEMLESKRELLLAIAHELRTPITRAKLHLELLDDSKRKSDLTYEVDEMSVLVNDLLESERLKEGHKALDLENASLHDILKTLMSSYDSELIDFNIEPFTLSLDKVRYTMALRNILNNALFYGQGHKVIVNQNQDYVEVINQGEDIPQDEITKITDAFYRMDKSRTRKEDGGGVGLGLYLVDRIVKAHGHQMCISSKSGKTSFRIYFKS